MRWLNAFYSTLQILLVNHINHANEVDETFRQGDG